MPIPTTMATRTRSIWRARLGSAFRTSLACIIVGCITLYGPLFLQNHIAFPALSYVTVILIVSEATLGDALRGCWHAVSGTFLGAIPGFLVLRVLGNARFSVTGIVLAVTLSSFAVAIPESTHVTTKRIALAQIVMVYVVTSVHGVHTGIGMHPFRVALSSLVGAVASVVALMIPYPRFSSYEVRDKCNQFKENASEMLNHYVNALCAENDSSAFASLSQAKALLKTGNILLQNIRLKQVSIQWERPQSIWSHTRHKTPADRLQSLEIPLRGMKVALTSPSFPARVTDQGLRDLVLHLKEKISVALKQCTCSRSKDPSTIPESKKAMFDTSLQAIVPTQTDLPSLFFLFCMNLVNDELTTDQSVKNKTQDHPTPDLVQPMNSKLHSATSFFISFWSVNTERLKLALKCSFSLGLAVVLGMMYSRENGYWSGLTLAVGMGFGREATFKLANVKAQGLVLGSIFGVLSCFVFRFSEIRVLSLLPWILLSSFLRCSRMYGQAGASSAVIGALIILGRKNYGPPGDFAIVRITEAFIAITCSITVELLLQPTRASTLAKTQLSQCLQTLHECIQPIAITMCLSESKEKGKKMRIDVGELGKLLREAEVEPNFWFLPFHNTCYRKLLGSLSKMQDLLYFTNHAMGFLVIETHRLEGAWKELQEGTDRDLNHFKKLVGLSVKCLQEVTSIKSLVKLEKEINARGITYDIELGNLTNADQFFTAQGEDETEKIVNSFVRHLNEVVQKIQEIEEEEELKGQMVLWLSAIGFCVGALMEETKQLEKSVKELVQWENPSSRINLYKIHCMIKALNT